MENKLSQPNDDFYVIDGERYDRVTRVLGYFASPELCEYFKRNTAKKIQETVDEACRVGSLVHKIVENDILGVPSDAITLSDVQVCVCVEAYRKFKEERRAVKFVGSEIRVSNQLLKVAGTIDVIDADGNIWDVKTSRNVYETQWVQLGMYAYMRYEEDVPTDVTLNILHLCKKTAEYTVISRPFDYELVSVFTHLLYAYRFFNKQKQVIF